MAREDFSGSREQTELGEAGVCSYSLCLVEGGERRRVEKEGRLDGRGAVDLPHFVYPFIN